MKRKHLLFCCLVVMLGFGSGCDKSDTKKDTAKTEAPDKKADKKADKKDDAMADKKADKMADAKSDLNTSEADIKLAEELKGQIKNAQFPYKIRSKKENAKAFLHLAATSDDPATQAAALQGIGLSWTSSERNDKKMLVNDDYRKVVLQHLGSSDLKVLGRAMDAAPNAIGGKTPHEGIIKQLTEIATTHEEGPARYAAVDAMSRARNFQKNKVITDALLKALDDKENYVISTALFRLQFAAYSLTDKKTFFTKVRGMLKHDNPGIRGRAALFVANAAPDTEKETLGSQIHLMLDDKDPYVRSAAISALSKLKRLKSVHKMIGMLDDSTKNTYDIRDFKKLTGESGWVHHDGSAWSRVDDALLYAIKSMTWSMKKNKFEYRKINYKTKDEDIKSAVKDARTWYKKNKSKLPAA